MILRYMSSKKNKCQFCDRDFSSKYCLSKHQKVASYCVAIQKELQRQDKDTIIAEKALEGNKLQEELIRLRILLEQKDVMLEQKDEVIKKLEASLVKHEDIIADIARQAATDQRDEVIKKLEARLAKHVETIADIARQPTTDQKDEVIKKLEVRLAKHEETIADIA